MKLKINGKEFPIFKISEMSFRQFNEIIVKNEVSDIPAYLSIITGMTVEEVMASQVKCSSFPALHAYIFDVDINEAMKLTPNVIEVGGKDYLTKDLSISTFGKSYVLELKAQGKDNAYVKSVYALAVALCEDSDANKISQIFYDLCEMNWLKVLPTAFFLQKRISKGKLKSKILLKMYIWGLKKINLKTLICQKRYAKLEKKLRLSSFVQA